jgi:hypothetical protein
MSRKKGGMFRTTAGPAAKQILKKVFKGDNPVESADKAKDVITAILTSAENHTTRAPTKARRNIGTFLENQKKTFGTIIDYDSPLKNVSAHDPQHSYRTPNPKPRVNKDEHEPQIPKTRRHRSTVSSRPYSYAPRLDNAHYVNKIINFELIH